jgi:hypothetical protein
MIAIAACFLVIGLITYYLLSHPKAIRRPELASISATITHPNGSPLADTKLSITTYGYTWNGTTDSDGLVTLPPQVIAEPIKLCALNSPRTSRDKCDFVATVDNAGKTLAKDDTLTVSFHNNYK